MIKSYTAFTAEIDDVNAAAEELAAQLDFSRNLLTHSIGILSCFAEFVASGVVSTLSERFPFEIIGATTIANMACGQISEMGLALLVLTSDDTEFQTVLTDIITSEDPAPLKAAYTAAVSGRGKPALLLSFAPLLFNVCGDFFVETLDEVSGGVPNFGTLPVDHNTDYSESFVIHGGEAYRNRYAMLLLYGDVSPDFYIGTISHEKVFPEKGLITGSQGSQLQSVNGKSVKEFLLSLGLTQEEDGSIAGINSFPLIVDYNDGTEPVVRAMFALTPEGSAVCSGRVLMGATLSMGRFDADEILSTTAGALDRALQRGRTYGTLLMYSCVGRYFALQYAQHAEMETALKKLAGIDAAYAMAYSGGEISPVYGQDGGLSNRSHSNTFIICAF